MHFVYVTVSRIGTGHTRCSLLYDNGENRFGHNSLSTGKKAVFAMGLTSSKLMDSLTEGTNFDHEEIDRLRKRFMKLDKDNSGTLSKEELLTIPGVSSNPLASRLIETFDSDGSGDVDFQEFITGLSIFSTKGQKEDKLKFAFQIYDIDKDGFISNGELFLVLKMMVGKNLDQDQLQQVVDRTIMENDDDGDGRLSFEEFKRAVEHTEVAQSLTLEKF